MSVVFGDSFIHGSSREYYGFCRKCPEAQHLEEDQMNSNPDDFKNEPKNMVELTQGESDDHISRFRHIWSCQSSSVFDFVVDRNPFQTG